MTRIVSALMLGIFGAALGYGQVTIAGPNTIQTGFAVVTPLYGGGTGLNVSDTLSARIGGNFGQTTVLSAPLVTLTNIPVNFDSNAAVNTAVTIVNPNEGGAAVTLTLRDQSGGLVGVRNITIAGRRQLSRFVAELFASLLRSPGPFEGLLFISSNANAPVVAMGLAFNGPSFTSLPVATQLNPNAVITAPFSLVGPSGILLPQIAMGGGWASRIRISNTSTVPQIIRIDFF